MKNLPRLWISGDLNLPNSNWNSGTVQGNNYPLAYCDVILEHIHNYALIQVVDTPN